jgi:hypothetical protein
MEARSLARQKPDAVEVQAKDIMARGQAITVVKTPEEYEGLVSVLRSVKTGLRVVEEHHKPMYDKAKATLESVKEAWDKFRKPLLQLETRLKCIGQIYLSDQARKRAALEAELLGAERKRQEKARDRQVKTLEKAGEVEQAAAVKATPLSIAPTSIEKPKVEGAAERHSWKHRYTDPALVPREWCDPSDKRIGSYVRSVGDKACIPGVEVYDEIGMAIKE